ncbi:MAG: hypothetical protein ACI9TY_001181 [Alphaproteobacteria bacterium]|jgi:hypothetical protein
MLLKKQSSNPLFLTAQTFCIATLQAEAGHYYYVSHENKTSVIIGGVRNEIFWPQFYWQQATVVTYSHAEACDPIKRLALHGETRDLNLKYFPSSDQLEAAYAVLQQKSVIALSVATENEAVLMAS